MSTFQCRRVSDHFRHLVVEVDIAESARRRPILPKYDTASLENRPSDLQRRILRIQDAYTDAGILVTFPRRHDIVPDSAEKFETWSDYELFDAMMDYFNARDAPEPGWAVWGFLAGRHDVDDVLGIMFDAWPNRRKNRQGFAIFGGNPYFAALAGGASRKRAEASRAYLFTWVHEIGHALGLYHWNENWNAKEKPSTYRIPVGTARHRRPSSWMTDSVDDPGFWRRFHFEFETGEVVRLRHGYRRDIRPGGNRLNHFSRYLTRRGEVSPSLEFAILSKRAFQYMEPVCVELKLKNLDERNQAVVDRHLNPAFGNTIVVVREPDGQEREYLGCAQKLAVPNLRPLERKGLEDGLDRVSEEVFLGYGADGFYFQNPGEYSLRGIYLAPDGSASISEECSVRIRESSRELGRLQGQFFRQAVGAALCMEGFRSKRRSSEMALLRHIAIDFRDDPTCRDTAREIGRRISPVYVYPSRTVHHNGRGGVEVVPHEPRPDWVLALTDAAVQFYRKPPAAVKREIKRYNFAYEQVVRNRVEAAWSLREDDLKKEVADLYHEFCGNARGINKPVKDRIRQFAAERGVEVGQ